MKRENAKGRYEVTRQPRYAFIFAHEEYSGVDDNITRTPTVSWQSGHLGPSLLITYVMTFISPPGSPHRADICQRRPSANDLHAATHEAK